MGTEGAELLQAVLRKTDSLQYFSLAQTSLPPRSVLKIVQSISAPSLTALQVLELSGAIAALFLKP